MVTINMKNTYSTIENLPYHIINLINDKLSYEIGGFGQPTEKKFLYDNSLNRTYTGLVPYILSILKKAGINYQLNDLREKHKSNANFKMNPLFEARDYQQEIVDRATSREILQAATGGGKTFIMAKLIEKFNVKPVLVIAPKVSLAMQIKEEFEKFLGVDIGIIGGGEKVIKDINVCTPQSIDDNTIKQAKMVLCDECLKYDQKVLMASGSYKKIGDLVKEKSTEMVMSYNHETEKIEPKPIIGHSETPLSKNGKKLMKLTIRKPDGSKEVIECTDNHKIWVESLGRYVEARQLVKGQKVKTLK